jgi:DNA-binding transcriptional MerR regulator
MAKKGNQAKDVLNAFSAADVEKISGLSHHTINYLAREGYLRPSYAKARARGRVRYYSYRDLLVARIIKKLTNTGIELKRLKKALKLLNQEETWLLKEGRRFYLLTTDGQQVYYYLRNGSLLELTPGLQQSFAFVLDVTQTRREVKQLITDDDKRRRFDLANQPLLYRSVKEKPRSR